nr:MAG TPA: hypothetical protein [Caudoviricetes sp.]
MTRYKLPNGKKINHEYMVHHFENGENSTFRNSHVDLFRI